MLKLSTLDPVKSKLKALAIPVAEDKNLHQDRVVNDLANKAKGYNEFKGAKGDLFIFYEPQRFNAQRVILVGVGKVADIDLEALRTISGQSVKKALSLDLTDIAILVPTSKTLKLNPEDVLTAMGEGARLANHQFGKYKKPKHSALKQIKLLVTKPFSTKYRALVVRINTICKGTLQARDWINTPANDKQPVAFARNIKQVAQKAGLKVEVRDDQWLKKQGFNTMLAVAQGSSSRPRLVVLKHQPKKAKKTVVLVGKGVTFDSGGINIKPTGSIETMKCDMSGAAAVAATLIVAAQRKLDVNLVGVLPLVENMPSGTAVRPGDIIKSWAGKTVEIGNTDAEGRLILIDAMGWAIKTFKPQVTIDMATLTGACVVALGEHIAGVFSPDDELADSLMHAGEYTHERCWRMPLPDDYKDQLKSDVADTNNMSNVRWGGAITAALFLSEFVKNTRWAHIDIAGPAFLKKAGAYGESGATGFGVRLIHRLLDTI